MPSHEGCSLHARLAVWGAMTHHIEADRNKQNNTARLPSETFSSRSRNSGNKQDGDGTQLKTGASGRPTSIKSSQATDGDKLTSEKHKHSLINGPLSLLGHSARPLDWQRGHNVTTASGTQRGPVYTADRNPLWNICYFKSSRCFGDFFSRVFETNYLYVTKVKTLTMKM